MKSFMRTAQKKNGPKRWNQRKMKEKCIHVSFVDQETFNRLLLRIPKLGKHISVSNIVQKFQVTGSIARMLLNTLVKDGVLAQNQVSSKQFMCYPKVQAADQSIKIKKEAKKEGKKKL